MELVTIDDCKSEFAAARDQANRGLRRMVEIVAYCIKKDLEIDWIPSGPRRHLVYIANNQLTMKAYERFQGTGVLRYLPSLPSNEQERLANGGKVKVVSFRNGNTEIREVEPTRLSHKEIIQVFNIGEIRDEAQQVSWLDGRAKARLAPSTAKPWIVDNDGTVTFLRNAKLTRRDLREILHDIKKAEVTS